MAIAWERLTPLQRAQLLALRPDLRPPAPEKKKKRNF